ncbi:MAG: 4'-phosphopantetheinyl transferase superfamily protein [Hyphomicrobiaceae bacterium]|nr:4'-phosphopantetheinyl transferase superfamily protein [Hyphomicrobiaceae bacterium]
MYPTNYDRQPTTEDDERLDLDLWRWPLDVESSTVEHARRMLSADEIRRADAFVFDIDRARFTIGRANLRQVLSQYTAISPQKLVFEYNVHGKPRIMRHPISFNLAHCEGWAAAVIAPAHHRRFALGIDIERTRNMERQLADGVFSAAEQQVLAGLSAVVWSKAFFRIWNRKEAVLKALGTGLSVELASFDATHEHVTVRVGEQIHTLTVNDFTPTVGFQGAIAVVGRLQEIKVHDRTLER